MAMGTLTESSSSPVPEETTLSMAGWQYEVFLSFHGLDTRGGFTDHLHKALLSVGIDTFRDNEKLRVGEEIFPDLIKAIENSKICIPIFSRNYASSKWCLREFNHMMKCRERKGQLIFPIFYSVSPSDVKNQTGSFEDAFVQHHKNVKKQIVQEWKAALEKVAELKGWELAKISNGHETKLIEMVIPCVREKLNKNLVKISDYLLGMDDHEKEMEALCSIRSDDVRIVGIHGMGGVGKTTIAKVIYNQLSERFDGWSFLADIRTKAEQPMGLYDVQKQLILDILHENLDVGNVSESGTDIISRRFRTMKVLIVLDDVDKRTQLEQLAKELLWFGRGSRIIITTRNKDVFTGYKEYSLYEPKEMDFDRSLQLFSKHAFNWDQPEDDYYDLSKEVVSTIGGLPLSLKIIGRFLFGKDKSVWKDTLLKLKKIPNDKVQEKLKISYDALDCEQKEIFLDIACLFIGMDKRIVFHLWHACEFFPENGIATLLSLSLVKIKDDHVIQMHDQLRDLGREIVRQENFKDPGKRSRLWFHKEALEVLQGHLGTRKVDALCLSGLTPRHNVFSRKEFKKLVNLRYLQMDSAELDGDFTHLLFKLRWLQWKIADPNFSPRNFHLNNLIILDLSGSNIPYDWSGWNQIKARKLKVLNVSSCHMLTESPDVSASAELTMLNLGDCINLVQIHPSVWNLKSLSYLNLKACRQLRTLGTEFHKMKAITEIILDDTLIREIPVFEGCLPKLEVLSAKSCYSLTQISSIGHLVSLVDVAFDASRITEVPDSIKFLVNLRRLTLKGCSELRVVSGSIGKLESLVELNLNETPWLKELPGTIAGLNKLRVLNLHQSAVNTLPDGIGKLENLEEFYGSDTKLEKLPDSIGGLKNLKVLNLHNSAIVELPNSVGHLMKLEELDVSTTMLKLMPDTIRGLKNLKVLNLSGSAITKLHFAIGKLEKLEELDASYCKELAEIPSNLENLYSLKILRLNDTKIYRLPTSISGLSCVRTIDFCGCSLKLPQNLKLPSTVQKLGISHSGRSSSIQKLIHESKFSNLRTLILDSIRIKSLKIDDLSHLEELTIQNCARLGNLHGLPSSLFSLDLIGCGSLETLPDMSNLKNLTSLVLNRCLVLTEVPGLGELKSLAFFVVHGCERLPYPPNGIERLGLNGDRFSNSSGTHDIIYLRNISKDSIADMHSQLDGPDRLKDIFDVIRK